MKGRSGSVAIVIKRARLTEADAEAHVHGICFKTGPPARVGVELEWLVRDRRDPALPVQAEQVAAALDGVSPKDPADEQASSGQARGSVRNNYPSLPSGATLTVEPGGQLELSSAPAVTLGELVEVTGRDLAALRDAAAAAGLELCGYGLDPLRPPRRVLDLPRYAAMAAAEPVWAGNERGPGSQSDAHDLWLRAARSGPADPHISRAARQCFEVADAALSRAGAPAPIRQAVADFTERYVLQDRCPANDQLDGVS